MWLYYKSRCVALLQFLIKAFFKAITSQKIGHACANESIYSDQHSTQPCIFHFIVEMKCMSVISTYFTNLLVMRKYERLNKV